MFLRIVSLCLLYLSLMLSGLFQIDFSVIMAVSLVPREAILTNPLSQQLQTLDLAHQAERRLEQLDIARTTKLTAGTQMRVGRESSLFVQPVLSLCGTALSFI